MSHGSEQAHDQDDTQQGAPEPRPMPRIRGVRPAEAETDPEDSTTPFDWADFSEDESLAVDPWGAATEDPAIARDDDADDTDDVPTESDPEPAAPAPVRRGGGTLTIPLLCIGVAVIACVALLPLADENHQLAWEREKLKIDLAYIQEQTRVQDEFLTRVGDDPTLAERLAQRQMKYIRQGSKVLPLRGSGQEEMSPFHLVNVPPPPPMPPYQPVGGALATIVRQPRAQLYLYGAALLLIATGLVLGYTPKPTPNDPE